MLLPETCGRTTSKERDHEAFLAGRDGEIAHIPNRLGAHHAQTNLGPDAGRRRCFTHPVSTFPGCWYGFECTALRFARVLSSAERALAFTLWLIYRSAWKKGNSPK